MAEIKIEIKLSSGAKVEMQPDVFRRILRAALFNLGNLPDITPLEVTAKNAVITIQLKEGM